MRSAREELLNPDAMHGGYRRPRLKLVCGTGPGRGAGGAAGGSTPAASSRFAWRHAHHPYAPTAAPIDR
jgi:hypothetical protein